MLNIQEDNQIFVEIENFKKDEFRCRCCGECEMTDKQLLLVQALKYYCCNKHKSNIRIFCVTKKSEAGSGYRCLKHNKDIGGVPDSTHTKGEASDLWTPDLSIAEFYEDAVRFGCFSTVIGYFKNNFVHTDSRDRGFETYIGRKN